MRKHLKFPTYGFSLGVGFLTSSMSPDIFLRKRLWRCFSSMSLSLRTGFWFPPTILTTYFSLCLLSLETSSSQVQELLKYCCEQEDGFFSTKHDTSGRSTYSLASQILPTIRKLKQLHSLLTNWRPPFDHYPSNWPIG